MDSWPITRASIIRRLHDPQDHEAWQLVVELYSPIVYHYCLNRGLQAADALDVSQEVFAKLRNFQFDPERGKFRAWLGTVARNQLNAFWRSAHQPRSVRDLEPSMVSQPDLDWERISQAHILDQALRRIRAQFSAEEWLVFEEVALEQQQEPSGMRYAWRCEQSPGLAAAKFGKSVEWVYKTKSAILKQLKNEVLFIAEELALWE